MQIRGKSSEFQLIVTDYSPVQKGDTGLSFGTLTPSLQRQMGRLNWGHVPHERPVCLSLSSRGYFSIIMIPGIFSPLIWLPVFFGESYFSGRSLCLGCFGVGLFLPLALGPLWHLFLPARKLRDRSLFQPLADLLVEPKTRKKWAMKGSMFKLKYHTFHNQVLWSGFPAVMKMIIWLPVFVINSCTHHAVDYHVHFALKSKSNKWTIKKIVKSTNLACQLLSLKGLANYCIHYWSQIF